MTDGHKLLMSEAANTLGLAHAGMGKTYMECIRTTG
jgi:hypothetical protein